jgi:hypothetical protein
MSFLKRLIPMKAKVWIELDKPAFQEGENVGGKVFIESNEYVRGDEVRVEARVFEHYSEMVQVRQNDQWVWERQQKKDTKFSHDVRIYGPMDFGNSIRNFPFNVNIPPFKQAHNDGSIEYSLKGVVAVKGRPDVTGEIDLSFVKLEQPVSLGVQKVRCEYCQSLMDVSVDRCPNCGATR